jgi:L-lactate dehydrogenase (cytochrome)
LTVPSNHGGRNLDTSPPGLMILLELRKFYPEVFEKVQVHLDGGIRRGTDILKALCLGATSVSLGRPFLYSVLYGEQGVQHLIQSKFQLLINF